jgi:hypothetical protein
MNAQLDLKVKVKVALRPPVIPVRLGVEPLQILVTVRQYGVVAVERRL